MNRFPHFAFISVLLLLINFPIDTATPERPAITTFTAQTASAGIHFTHSNGATGKKYLPETMGAGGLFFDYDNDGNLDIFLVNSGSLLASEHDTATNALYKNSGDGTFTDVTQMANVGGRGYGMGCIAADYDNDGDTDLYLTHFGENQLYRNNGDGTFTDVTVHAGVGDARWSVSASFGDFDLDGRLDLYIANYLDYTLETAHDCYMEGVHIYCSPHEYQGVRDTLYRNNGDGTFTDVTEAAGVTNQGKGLGVLFTDYNADGYPDIFVTNDTVEDFLYRNNGDGTFTNVANDVGVAYNADGRITGSMGIANGDYDNDGKLDLFVTNFSLEVNSLFHNDGDGFYTMTTFDAGLARPSFAVLGFGTQFLDCDNDGNLDLFVANGHVWDNVELVNPNLVAKQTCQLFHNNGDGGFNEISQEAGAFFSSRLFARGTAVGDYDNDGDADLLVTTCGGAPALLRNDATNHNHWLQIKLIGTRSNRDGIGAKVRVQTENRTQVREVTCGGSYASDSAHTLHFGLGDATTVQTVKVTWPSGHIQLLKNARIDETITIIETP
jgi:hypothetical protein